MFVQTANKISHSAILQNYKTGPRLSSPSLPSTYKNTGKQSASSTKSTYRLRETYKGNVARKQNA
jgi:hypothetical protein